MKYGFVARIADSKVAGSRSKEVVRHGILLADAAAFDEVIDLCNVHINHLDTLSLAFNYPENIHPIDFRKQIDLVKQNYSGRINFIRPDLRDGHKHIVSAQKIIDNAICDTVRVKYFPVRRNGNVKNISSYQEAVDFFKYASRVYKENKMYHRAPSDGYFALRAGNGFFVTATKSNKVDLDLNRISYVHYFAEKSGHLCYTGEYLPSSDSVECQIALNQLPGVRALVHTHASDLFTRNPDFQQYVKIPRLPYGEPLLGYSLASALKGDELGFVIMEDHGEVFALDDPSQLQNKILKLRGEVPTFSESP